ncbi:MAG: hypothetical protein N0C90_25255 [Candidatus Thiodiazotropha endolucinida]|nr:hypothetical protein [Candidatus Thiodiazotropha taylori]MCW4264660.1 hypothetical protein [Candidatus Thiodiazotropha endolucinida]
MKSIPNEPENLTKRREKQVLDNFRAEIEIIRLRRENQEEKYKAIDNKMKEEISKIAAGQRRVFLLKLWEEDCERNKEISQKRWNDKNAAWFVKYEKSFRNNHANNNPFIKIGEISQTPRSYADAVSTPQYNPSTNQQQQQPEVSQGQQVLGTEMNQIPLPRRAPRQRIRQPSPRQTGTEAENGGQRTPLVHQGAANPQTNYPQRGKDGTNEGQQYFLVQGRGRGRGRGRARGRGRGRGRGRPPNMQ